MSESESFKNKSQYMKNFVTFLIIAVVVIVIIVLIKKPDTDTMNGSNGASGTILEGSEAPDNGMIGGDAEASIEIGGQGDTTVQ